MFHGPLRIEPRFRRLEKHVRLVSLQGSVFLDHVVSVRILQGLEFNVLEQSAIKQILHLLKVVFVLKELIEVPNAK